MGPLPILGEGEPRKWWVRECFKRKSEEIGEFVAAPHPDIWTKKLSKSFHAKWFIFINEINLLKTLAQWERRDHVSGGWGYVLKGKARKLVSLKQPLIRPGGHLLPDGEGKEFVEIFSRKKDQFGKCNQCTENHLSFRWWLRDLIDFIKIKRSVNWQKSPTIILTIQAS